MGVLGLVSLGHNWSLLPSYVVGFLCVAFGVSVLGHQQIQWREEARGDADDCFREERRKGIREWAGRLRTEWGRCLQDLGFRGNPGAALAIAAS